jgi:hypothetical protein
MAQLTSGTTIAGSTAWHSGNDGSGSGLDADLLDGQSSSYYATASLSNVGTLPANVKAQLKGDTGPAGSLFDGSHTITAIAYPNVSCNQLGSTYHAGVAGKQLTGVINGITSNITIVNPISAYCTYSNNCGGCG